jgi:deoxyribose-phosphate aldolase
MSKNKLIDYSILKPNTTSKELDEMCKEAIEYNVAAICCRPTDIVEVKRKLKKTDIKTIAVVGFPFGYETINTKFDEAEVCIGLGAEEIDAVINIGKLLSGDYDYAEREIYSLGSLKGKYKVKIKIIFETCYLNDEQIVFLCNMCKKYKIDYAKTSTGFGPNGATEQAVKLMIDNSEGKYKVKASGGIKTKEAFDMYAELGCDRIGTSALKEVLG